MSEPGAGPLADEAAKLLGAAQQWLHRMLADPATARVANGSPDCCWCPVCQLIAMLRGERPEVAAKLSDLQAAVSGLLTTLADSPGAPEDPGPRPSRVHKISLDDLNSMPDAKGGL